MKKFTVLFCMLILATSPVFALLDKKMNEIMESWVGEDIDYVIDNWGYPTKERTVNKRKLYYWVDDTKYMRTNFSQNNRYKKTSYNAGLAYGQRLTCTKIFEVDENNKVVKWNWQGNHCPKNGIRGNKLINPKSVKVKQDNDDI